MKHAIEPTADGLRIRADVDPAHQPALLAELGRCATGHCSCPTPQYAKVEAMEVAADATGVTVDLRVRAGESIDEADIARCLEHAGRQTGG